MGLSGQPGVCRSVFQVFYRFSFSSTETIAFELKVFGKILLRNIWSTSGWACLDNRGFAEACFKYSLGFLFRWIASSKLDLFSIVPLLSWCLWALLSCSIYFSFLPFGFWFFGFWRAFGANHLCFFCWYTSTCINIRPFILARILFARIYCWRILLLH